MVDMLNSTHKSSTNHSGSLCPAHNSSERPKHNHTVSWNMSVEEDLKYNVHNYLRHVVSCDRLVRKKKHICSVYVFLTQWNVSVVTGQCVRLGLSDSGLDLGCLLLWLHPDTDPRGLPGQPMWTQVAVGIGNSGNCGFYAANTPGCRFRPELSLRCSDAWRDRRGRRSRMFHFVPSLDLM